MITSLTPPPTLEYHLRHAVHVEVVLAAFGNVGPSTDARDTVPEPSLVAPVTGRGDLIAKLEPHAIHNKLVLELAAAGVQVPVLLPAVIVEAVNRFSASVAVSLSVGQITATCS